MSDGHDFDSYGQADIAVAIYALRTFKIEDGKLSSVVVGAGHWENGVCVAICTKNADHEAPADGCNCGIYGTHTLQALFRQYGSRPAGSSR